MGFDVEKLIYVAQISLDGYFEAADGNFGSTMPDDEVYAYVNDLARPISTLLYGRRMYETMVFWETATDADRTVAGDYATIWRNAEKIVYSKTLAAPSSAKTRIERNFDPDVIRELKLSKAEDVAVAGGNLAAQAFHAGLVDECYLFVYPVSFGGGKHSLPHGLRLHLELVDERRFESGVVLLHHSVRTA